jgi:hypothetical protein
MKRNLALLFLLPCILPAGDDPVAVFHSCAYTTTLPPAPSTTQPLFEMRSAVRDEVIPEGYAFDRTERFVIRVTGGSEGSYFYIFQDPPDPHALLYQAGSAKGRAKDVAYLQSPAIRFNSTTDFTLLYAITPEPIPNAEQMRVTDVRQYLAARSVCWGPVLKETKIQFRGNDKR